LPLRISQWYFLYYFIFFTIFNINYFFTKGDTATQLNIPGPFDEALVLPIEFLDTIEPIDLEDFYTSESTEQETPPVLTRTASTSERPRRLLSEKRLAKRLIDLKVLCPPSSPPFFFFSKTLPLVGLFIYSIISCSDERN
jgi:hypothetical protein